VYGLQLPTLQQKKQCGPKPRSRNRLNFRSDLSLIECHHPRSDLRGMVPSKLLHEMEILTMSTALARLSNLTLHGIEKRAVGILQVGLGSS